MSFLVFRPGARGRKELDDARGARRLLKVLDIGIRSCRFNIKKILDNTILGV